MPIVRGGNSPKKTLADLQRIAKSLEGKTREFQSAIVGEFSGVEYEQVKDLHVQLVDVVIAINVFLGNQQIQYEKEERDRIPTETLRCDQCHHIVTYQDKRDDCWRYMCPDGHETLVTMPNVMSVAYQPSPEEDTEHLAVRNWHRRAIVRILETTSVESLSPHRTRTFRAGEETEMIQWGWEGNPVNLNWWDSTDIDGAFIIDTDKAEIVRVLEEVAPFAWQQ